MHILDFSYKPEIYKSLRPKRNTFILLCVSHGRIVKQLSKQEQIAISTRNEEIPEGF